MKTMLQNLIIQGWPESVAVIIFCLAILRQGYQLRTVVLYGFLLATAVCLVRILPIPLGVHTLVACLGLTIVLRILAGVSFATSFYTTFIGLFVLACTETLVHVLYITFFGDVAYGDGWQWILIGWPQILIIMALTLLIKKYNSKSYKVGKTIEYRSYDVND
ncbi:hypothetical protein V6C27_09410 [Peptococcaceae bacterium 1198_IL3148]